MAVPLFHGPTAREAAILWAESQGRLLAPPFGEGGLGVDTSREIIEILGSTPVGDQLGTVVVGPMDLGRVKSVNAVEAFLKTLEELPESIVRVALWADDAADVLPTVRSRSEEKWCPPNPEATPEAPYLSIAESLCEAALRRRTAVVLEMFKERKRQKAAAGSDDEDDEEVSDETSVVGIEEEVLRASAVVLATKEDWSLSARLKLWASLREVLSTSNPTRRAYLAAYLV